MSDPVVVDADVLALEAALLGAAAGQRLSI
jgi:hypothetical protein